MTPRITLIRRLALSWAAQDAADPGANLSQGPSFIGRASNGNLDFHEPLPKNWSPGSLHLEWKRCGRLSCKCTQGRLHGPYVYLHRRHGSKQHKAYVAMRDLAKVIEELEQVKADRPRPAIMLMALKGDTP